MSVYTVCWAPIGPEVSVSCPSLEEALALADELVAIGKIGNLRILKDDQIMTLGGPPTEGDGVH